MKDSDKIYLNTLLKTIFEKAIDSTSPGVKELELFIRHRVNAYKIEESLEALLENIKKELDNNSVYKQNIMHGNMKIFEILFNIIRLYKVSDKIYFNIISTILQFLTETNENEKNLITNAASTIIKLIKGKRQLLYSLMIIQQRIIIYQK